MPSSLCAEKRITGNFESLWGKKRVFGGPGRKENVAWWKEDTLWRKEALGWIPGQIV